MLKAVCFSRRYGCLLAIPLLNPLQELKGVCCGARWLYTAYDDLSNVSHDPTDKHSDKLWEVLI